MTIEFFNMNGYGLYVWSAFSFTLMSFYFLYMITKVQFNKEREKFVSKYGALEPNKAKVARLQIINREILSNTQSI
tara:strand:- start:286 stop:513 length:228 start_codon:yes stop_codon:yes gene_type:complete